MVVARGIADRSVGVLVVVAVEAEVVADRFEGIGAAVRVEVAEPGEFGLLGDDDGVRGIVLDHQAEAFVGAFREHLPGLVLPPPDAGGAGADDDGPVLGHGHGGIRAWRARVLGLALANRHLGRNSP